MLRTSRRLGGASSASAGATCWLTGKAYSARGVDPRKVAFDRDGFVVLRGFVSAAACAAMRARMAQLVVDWDPAVSLVRFRTDAGQSSAQAASDYFLASADRVHFFAEPAAVNDAGELCTESKAAALNKVGHGLHLGDDVFGDYARGAAVAELAAALGWSDPVLPQSMYIFKNPHVGGEVTSHQDSTFLHTVRGDGGPWPSALGLWLALDEATVENGCLWVRPASHREPLRRVFVRSARVGGDEGRAVPGAPLLVFEACPGAEAVPWEGGIPGHRPGSPPDLAVLRRAAFEAVEVAAGDLVAFAGTLDHLSLPNASDRPRHTFQLHLVEGPAAGCHWAPSNWLQYPRGKAFPSVARGRPP